MGMMEGYVDVAERIRQLREKHPHAVLRPWNPDEPFRLMTIGDREFVVYTAACYRTPDDPMPAVAVAAEPAVGKTNFTRDSEVMNAETSAWGRAIVACLAADTQRIASVDEIRNRQADSSVATPVAKFEPRDSVPIAKSTPARPPSAGTPATDKQIGLVRKLAREHALDDKALRELVNGAVGREIETIKDLSKSEASRVIEAMMALPVEQSPELEEF